MSQTNPQSIGSPNESNVAMLPWHLKVLGYLLLLGGGLLIAILFVEVAFRFLYKPAAQWNDRPRTYYIPENSKVMTDGSYPAKKGHNTFRIAVVGDSFSFAPYMQYDDTFAKRLERWLNLNQKQPKVEVINYGVPRYSTSHEVAVVEKALKEDADLILLQITLNDPEIKPYRPTGLLIDEKTGNPALENSILKNWKSMAFVMTRIFNTQSHTKYRDYFFGLFENRDSWDNFRKPVRTIVKMARDKNVPIVSVVFPLFGYPVNEAYPFYPLHQKVGALLGRLKVPFLDITENYRDIPIDRLQVMPGADRHPNEVGHRIAAEAILPWLASTQLLPRASVPNRAYPERIGIIIPE